MGRIRRVPRGAPWPLEFCRQTRALIKLDCHQSCCVEVEREELVLPNAHLWCWLRMRWMSRRLLERVSVSESGRSVKLID